MKINIIIDKNNNDSNLDSNILHFLFKKIKDKTDIKVLDYNNFKCEKASINIFCGVVNNILFNYAKTNILIINQQEFSKAWIPFINNFDYVIAKTKYIENILSNLISKKKIKYLSWRSSDLGNNSEKDFDEILLFCYDNKFADYKNIVDNWKPHYNNLNIVNGPQFNLTKKQDNIIYHNNLSQLEFENLFNNCGIHLCLNSIVSFPHNLNQCALTKSIPVTFNEGPFKELFNEDDIFTINSTKQKNNSGLGHKYKCDLEQLEDIIKQINNLSESTMENIGENLRKSALKNHSINDALFKEFFASLIKETREKKNTSKEIVNNELPKISIVTLTHNRKNFFKLAIYNYNTCNYPKDKIEWVIYDTSNEENKVLDLLPNEKNREKMNIKYIYNNELISIGKSRTNACKEATHDIILFNDDDDYYYENSIKNRVNALINSDKKIVGCSIIGSFNINKYISFIETLPLTENLGKRLYPGTMCFYKEILEKASFDDENLFECNTLINLHLTKIKEITWEDIIVSIVHKNNISFRKTPKVKPNGSHFNLSEKIFKFITSLEDNENNTNNEK